MKRPFRTIAVTLLGILCTATFAGGLSACKKHGPVDTVKGRTTVREALPTDGSLPTQHTALENIGYMATVLDGQPSYHVYAYNSTKAMGGYEQVTQSWKDYKNSQLSGIGQSVMICSDLSYSMLVQSSTQSCFVGDKDAYMRKGKKPKKTSVPTSIEWSTDQPEYYDSEAYLYKYGEFSTELSVYVLDKDSVISADDVIDNGDGTYSQKYYLNEGAACWYQYGMKTRGSLKGFPEYKKIEITFTFDGNWQVLSTYCEEKAKISPSALGGMPQDSNSKTTTNFDYTASGFGNDNYAYFENYYKGYVGNINAGDKPTNDECKHEIVDVLGGGFGKVLTAEGQQFALDITIGETQYDGKVFIALPDMGNVLGTLDVRFQLGRKDSGKQDLYIEFKNGAVNAYYSDTFAVTADINKVSGAVGKFAEWVKGLDSAAKQVAGVSDGEGFTLDLSSLLNAIKYEQNETSATVSIITDDLLGLKIGTDITLNFGHNKGNDGCLFDFKDLSLKGISYDGTEIHVSGGLTVDNSPSISRNPTDTPADIAEYINGVYELLNSESLKVDISLNGLTEGLTLNATAFVKYLSGIAAEVDVTAEYKGISATLNAYYVYDGGYGKVYLNLTEFNGNAYDAKVYCDVKDTVDAVRKIIGWANGISVSAEQDGNASGDLATIINKVLNLNFGKILIGLEGNKDSIGLTLDADELLNELDVDLGVQIGTVGLKLINGADGKVSLNANLDKYGLNVAVNGSDKAVVKPDGNYVDIVNYINSVYAILNSKTLKVELGLDGLIEGLNLNAVAYVNYKDEIASKVEITAEYEGISLALNAYYVYDGGYGKLYLNLTEFNGNAYDAKVYCDIKDTVDAVKQIIALFGTERATLSYGQSDVLAKAISYALGLNYNDIIEADNTSLKVTVDVDEILGVFGVDLGIQFGKAALEYTTNSTLTANIENIGLSVKVTGSDETVAKPDGDYVDIIGYINSVYAILNSKTLKVELGLDGLIEGLNLNAVAYVNYKDEIASKVEITAEYEGISLALNAYYVYDGGYGKLYLNLTEFNGNAYDAKVYCDIKDTVDAVKQIIALFGTERATLSYGQSDVLAKAISYALGLNYNDIIEADNTSLKVTVDVDEILGVFGVDLGIQFGKAALEYTTNSTLTANIENIGLSVKVTGSDETVTKPDGDYVDIIKYIDSIYGLLLSESYEISLSVNGNAAGVISYLEGATVEGTILIQPAKDFSSVAVKADVTVNYCGNEISLIAHYVYNGGYGDVYLNVTAINGVKCDAKVYCDIQDTVNAIKQLIDAIQGVPALAMDGETVVSNKTAEIVKAVLSIDYPSIIKQFKATDTVLNATVDADAIVALFVENLGVSFGEVSLTFNNATEAAGASLIGNVPALGLEMGFKGSAKTVIIPDVNSYLNLTDLILLVQKATAEAQEIIATQDVVFELNAEVIVDGVSMKIKGNGEASWIDGKIRVAADAVLSIAENGKSDSVDVKFVYDETAADDKPLVRFAINSYGMEIYRSDIDGLVNDFNDIIDAVNKLLGKTAQTEIEQVSIPATQGGTGVDVKDILDLINTDNAQAIIKTVLGFVSDLTVQLQYSEGQPDVYGILISHAVNGNLQLSSNGNLALNLDVYNNNGTKITGVNASVAAGAGSLISDIDATLNGNDYTLCKSSETEKFIKVLYNYLFELIDNKLSVSEILGSSTFTVNVKFNGAESAISEIQNISVNAKLYYTEGLSGDKTGSKLVEAEIKLNIGAIPVELNARYSGQYVYIELLNIAGTQLDGMKFKADVHEIYTAAETVVKIITSENLAGIVAKFGGSAQTVSVLSEEGEQTKLGITEILAKLLNLDFNKVVNFSKDAETGENVLTLNPDVVLGEFGIDVNLGTVTASVNASTHKICVNAKLDGKQPWLALDAYADSENRRGTLDTEAYIDISFVSTLLKDLSKSFESITADKILYSLTGTVSVNLVNMADVVIEKVTLTVGLDENDQFYFTLYGDLQKSTAVIFTVATASRVSITYSNGYIVLGRDVDGSSPKYRVVTLAYFIDNLLDKNNSPLFWWLGTGNVTGLLGLFGLSSESLGLSSGLTTPETMYMYELAKASSDDKFFLSSILNGFTVNTDGNPLTYKTGDNAVSALNLKGVDRYYALDINANGLTGGVVPVLYAAIMRDGVNGGISGLKAYAKVKSYITANINLDGVTSDHKPNYYNTFDAETAINGYVAESPSNHTTPIFGMYDSANNAYYSSNVLDTVTLKVVGVDGNEDSYDLRYGSTVYLSSTFAPEWTDENKNHTYIYKDADGNVLGESIVLEADSTVYIYKAEDVVVKKEIVFHTGVDGVGDVSAALVADENSAVSLQQYEIADYTLIGWYFDENHTLPITDAAAFDGTDVYCVYAKSVVTVNGVKYRLYNVDGVLTYHVNGFDENGILPYTASGSVLILESSIGGYPVTEIDVASLKLSNIKNIVVPASITVVNADAFMDNKDMESAVFLADKVFFGGSSWTNDGNRYPFYGTGTSADENVTILNIYYNIAESVGSNFETSTKGNTDWMGFKKDGSKYKYIGDNGGSRNGWRVDHDGKQVGEGNYNWAYVNYEIVSVNNNKSIDVKSVSFAQLVNINTVAKGAEEIAAYVKDVLNSLTKANGYINAFNVEVSGGVELNGTAYTLTITITELPQDEWYYLLSVESAIVGLSSGVTTINGNYETVDGLTYVQTGAEVTVISLGDETYNAFAGWTSTNSNLVLTNTEAEMTFAMPVGSTKLYSAWKADYAENIYVYSEVAFTYNGVEYGTQSVEITNAAVGRPLADAKAVESGKYTFAGWALANADNSLAFIDVPSVQSSESEVTYYAIWFVNREEVTSINGKFISGTTNPNADSSGVSVSVDTSKVAGFNKWYADAAFTDAIESFTVSTTVLYARMKYSFTYTFSGNGDTYFYVNSPESDSSLNKNNSTAKGNSYGNTVEVFEGVEICVSITNEKHTVIIAIGDEIVNVRAKKRNGLFNGYSAGEMREFTLETLDGDWKDNCTVVKGNINLVATF